jgi:hypothetical protein
MCPADIRAKRGKPAKMAFRSAIAAVAEEVKSMPAVTPKA